MKQKTFFKVLLNFVILSDLTNSLCNILDQILNKVRTVDPNNSEAIKEALTSFFQKLPKDNEPNCNAWLREMRNIIDRY